MSKRKGFVLAVIIFLAIGFAAVATTLIVNGTIALGNSDDFKIIFTNAILDNVERKDFISSDKIHIQFESNTLKSIDDETTLEYEVTNTSRNYDADVKVTCTAGENEYIHFAYTPSKMTVEAGKTETGSFTASMFRVAEEEQDVAIECELIATPIERESLGDEYAEKEVNYLAYTSEDVINDQYILEKYGSYDGYDDYKWDICDSPEYGEYESEACQELLNGYRDYLAKYVNYTFLWDSIDNYSVETISFLDNNDVPDNIITSWDASDKQNGSIMAYTLDEDNDGVFEVYIGQDGGVIANPNSSHLFENFRYLTSINGLDNLDTSNVTDMSSMFDYCGSLTTLDLSNFDTSNVLSMIRMFRLCSNLTTLDVSSFDTSKVTNMSYMFSNCRSLTTLDLSNFDTSKVTDMNNLFSTCSNLTTLDISNFDTNNVTNMVSMFMTCNNLTTLDLSNFDTSKVTDMTWMFSSCSNLIILNISNFDTSNVTAMPYMFRDCSSITTLDLSSFDTSNVKSMSSMFDNCSSLTTLDISNFNTSNVTNKASIFKNMPSTATIKVKNTTTQDWILALYGNQRPSAWTTANVIIA